MGARLNRSQVEKVLTVGRLAKVNSRFILSETVNSFVGIVLVLKREFICYSDPPTREQKLWHMDGTFYRGWKYQLYAPGIGKFELLSNSLAELEKNKMVTSSYRNDYCEI